MTIRDPIKPIKTAIHLFIPTFSFNNIGDKAVTIRGLINAKVKALANEITDMEQKKRIFAERSMRPLKNCNFGFFDQTRFFLKKININDNVKTTVKKYLPQVICKTGNEPKL